jgi:hypothetical protein
MYTKEQAEKNKAEYERMAKEAEAKGDRLMAGVWRVEASNCMDRIGMTKAHKPNLGPYSPKNPAYCEDCDLPLKQWKDDEECIPNNKDILKN